MIHNHEVGGSSPPLATIEDETLTLFSCRCFFMSCPILERIRHHPEYLKWWLIKILDLYSVVNLSEMSFVWERWSTS